MSNDKNENELIKKKDSRVSEKVIKTYLSYTNPQTDKRSLLSSLQNFQLNTQNLNFTNSNLIKNLNFSNENHNKNYYTTTSSISTNSTPLKIIQPQKLIEISPEKETEIKINKKLLNNFQYNQLVNNLNNIFSKIQNLYSQNYPCPKECNLWIEYFKYLYYDIIEKNKNNEFFELIKNTLMLMLFSMILIYDINNKNKQRFFVEDVKNIFNIHSLMSESIYNNSFNNPNINPKDESQVLMLSCKDMHNKLLKILNQYGRIDDNETSLLFPIFKKLKNESFDNIYEFYINEIRNPNHIVIKKKNSYNNNNNNNNENKNINKNYDNKKKENIYNQKNKISSNQYQSNTANIPSNYNLKNNNISEQKNYLSQNSNITNLNGVGAYCDSSNNVFLFRRPIKSATPNKQKQIPQYNQILNPQYSNNLKGNNLINPEKLFLNNINNYNTNTSNTKNNNNYIIQNDPYIKIEEKKDKKYNKNDIKDLNEKLKILTPQNGNKNFKIQYNQSLINQKDQNNNKAYPKTPILTNKKIPNQNIGQLNLNIIKNSQLSAKKIPIVNNNNSNNLIPFPPTKPYTLVLDLDETLVHVPKGSSSIILRPGLRDFLHSLLPYYELIVFTTGIKEYADQILNFIENEEKYFSYRLYRQNATIFKENYCKDLNKLGRDIKKTIIVDDKKISMELQEANGIMIKPFVFNSDNHNDDYILFDLIRILIRIAKEKPDDVRVSLKCYRDEINNKISLD